MASPSTYGEIAVVTAYGKTKLGVKLTPKVKLAVTKFAANNGIYVHVSSREKSISLSWEEFEDLSAVKAELMQKLHLLEQTTNTQALQSQGQLQQGQLQQLQQVRAQPGHVQQGQQGHMQPGHHRQDQAQFQDIWDDVVFQ